MWFVGYCKNAKGYRLLDEKTRKIVKKRDVTFNETDFYLATPGAETETRNREIGVEPESSKSEEEPCQVENDSQQPEEIPRRSERQRGPPVRYGYTEHADTAEVDHVAYNVCQIIEPKTIQEALASKHAKHWKIATDSEYESLVEKKTWELVELPQDREAIGCKWVFKVKYTSDGKVDRFKGRLVAKGFSQKYSVDYDETFAPVVRFSSIRALLAFAVQNNMLIHQMDIVTAFLNGELSEEIYMQQPDGYVIPGKEHLVCKLKKSLYGLKQSPHCWNKTFQEYMELIGFSQSLADPCVYIRVADTMAVVAVYVDDLILITATSEEMQDVKGSLANQFRMKDMGRLHYCLGIYQYSTR